MPENNQLLYATAFQDAVAEIYKSPNLPLLQVVDRSFVKNLGERQVIPIIQKFNESEQANAIERSSDTTMSGTNDAFWDTRLTNISSKNRINKHNSFAKATLVSQFDTMKEVSDPTQKYMTVIKDFIETRLNRLILKALTAPVIEETEGQAGAGTLESRFNTNNVIEAAGDTNDHIFDALKRAKVKFDEKYVNAEDRFLICKSETAGNLLYSSHNASSLYASSMGVKGTNGDLKGLLGFNVLQEEKFENIPTVKIEKVKGQPDKKTNENIEEDNILAILVQRKAVALGMLQDIRTNISDRPDKNLAKQLYVTFTAGATRVYDEGVVVIKKK